MNAEEEDMARMMEDIIHRGVENGAAEHMSQQMYRNIAAARRRMELAEDSLDDAEFTRLRQSRVQRQVETLYNLARKRATHPTFYQSRDRPFRLLPQALQDDITRALIAQPESKPLRMYRAMLGMNKCVINLRAKPLTRNQLVSLISHLKLYGKESPRELYLTTSISERDVVTLDHVIQLLKHLKVLEVVELHGVIPTDVILHALPKTMRKFVIQVYVTDLTPQGIPDGTQFTQIIHPTLPMFSLHALLTLLNRCPQLTWIEAPRARVRDENALFHLLDARPELTCIHIYVHLSISVFTQFMAKYSNTSLKLQKYNAEDNKVDKLNISTLLPDIKYLKFGRTSNMDNYLELKNVEELTINADTHCSDYDSQDLLESLGKNLLRLECSGSQDNNGLNLFYVAKYCPRLVNLKYHGYDIASQGEGPFAHDPDMDLILFNMYNEGIVPQYFRYLQSV